MKWNAPLLHPSPTMVVGPATTGGTTYALGDRLELFSEYQKGYELLPITLHNLLTLSIPSLNKNNAGVQRSQTVELLTCLTSCEMDNAGGKRACKQPLHQLSRATLFVIGTLSTGACRVAWLLIFPQSII